MKTFQQIYLLAFKDLRIFVKDTGALIFALGFPLLFILAFSLILPDADQDESVELRVATSEGPEGLSRQVIAGLSAIPDIEVVELDPAEAASRFEDDDLPAYLHFPENFSAGLQQGEPVVIEVITDGDNPQQEAFLRGIAESVAREVSIQQASVMAAVALAVENGQPPDPAAVSAAIAAAQQDTGSPAGRIGLEQVQVGDIEPVPAAAYVLPGYITMFLFFAASFGATELLTERRNNTLDRLIASGVSPTTILAGKWSGLATRAAVQAAVLWTFGLLFFGLDMGEDPLATVAVTLAMLVASVSFALLLASLVRTPKAADSASTLTSLAMAALGGSWWPIFIMPEWMQTLAKITPHAWANEAFTNLMLFGARGSDVILNIVALLLFGAVFVAVAAYRLNLQAE